MASTVLTRPSVFVLALQTYTRCLDNEPRRQTLNESGYNNHKIDKNVDSPCDGIDGSRRPPYWPCIMVISNQGITHSQPSQPTNNRRTELLLCTSHCFHALPR